MPLGNMMFWLFLTATVVASLAFVSIMIWTSQRVQERQMFYRFEFRKRLVEDGKMDAAAFAALMRYEHELSQQKGRQRLLVTAFVFIGIGAGTCAGLMFLNNSVWMVGLIPTVMGLFMAFYGLVFAPNPDLGTPPIGASPQPGQQD